MVLSTSGAFFTHVCNINIPIWPIYQCPSQQFRFGYSQMDVMDSSQKFISEPNWYHDSILEKYDAIDYAQLEPVRKVDLYLVWQLFAGFRPTPLYYSCQFDHSEIIQIRHSDFDSNQWVSGLILHQLSGDSKWDPPCPFSHPQVMIDSRPWAHIYVLHRQCSSGIVSTSVEDAGDMEMYHSDTSGKY